MKKTVVVLFGGQSSEHEISCMSAQTVVGAMDKDKYNRYHKGGALAACSACEPDCGWELV